MRPIIAIAAAAFAALSGAGCASLRGFPERSEQTDAQLAGLEQKYFLPQRDVLAEYAQLGSGEEKRSYRNEVAYGRMMAIDLQFSVFEKNTYVEGLSTNLALDVLGVAMGGAGATVLSADASRILSALSGGIAGAGTAINKNLYYERTMPALMALMEAEREAIRADMIYGLQQDAETYSLGQALMDLEKYYRAGSIPGAIAAVTETAGAQKRQAEVLLSSRVQAGFTDPAAQRRVEELLNLVDALPAGAAGDLLANPPAPLDASVAAAVQGRLGGTPLSAASPKLAGLGNDADARAILKFVLVLLRDRSESNLGIWKAAIASQAQ